MHYELSPHFLAESFAVPRAAEEFFSDAGEVDLRVLLFAASRVAFEEEELFSALGEFEEAALRESLAFWRGAGLFSKQKKRACRSKTEPKNARETAPTQDAQSVKIISSRPNYTSFDLACAVEQSREFKSLIDYAEQRLEKVFNRADLSLLYSFVDYLALPVDVVMLAIESCAKEGKKNLRYIEKLLIALVDEEIVTYEAADAYFAHRAEYLSFEGRVRTLCGFQSRALTAAEKKLITAWNEVHHYSEEELEQAYEKTVNAIAKPSISYMNKVLATLRETPGEAEQAGGKTYDTKSRFAEAVARTKKKRTEEKQ